MQCLNRLQHHVLNGLGDRQADDVGFIGLRFFEGAELAVKQAGLHVMAHTLLHAFLNQFEVTIEEYKTHIARLFADAVAVDPPER